MAVPHNGNEIIYMAIPNGQYMEIRKDYLLDRWVILSEGRGLRPKEFSNEHTLKREETDFFAPGNEHLTPPELERYPVDTENWQIRVFNNKFPAATLDSPQPITTHNDFYTFGGSYGDHEVIVETPDSERQLWDFSTSEHVELLKMYMRRIDRAYENPQVKYVLVFKNHGPNAGTSLMHSHSQLVSLPFMPPEINEKVQKSRLDQWSRYLHVIEKEKDSVREAFSNEHFIAFCPYASRFNYELWIMPRSFICTLSQMTGDQIYSLAEILGRSLSKLKELGVSYNLHLNHARKEQGLLFHIEILPRVATWGGFEFGSGIVINSVSPENAAGFYRGEIPIEKKT